MKEYDFVFVYEVKNRELENICLIRYELERRGYRVEFVETWNRLFYRARPPRAHVTVSFALYNSPDFVLSFVRGCRKIVNLQWEQVFSNGTVQWLKTQKEALNCRGISGIARTAAHISWGKNNYHALTELYGVTPSHVRMTGYVALDFLRPELQGFYLSREALFHRYHIPTEKKVCLFISSLAFVNLPKETLSNPMYSNLGYNVAEYAEVSAETQKLLVEWFERALSQREDCILIYRPHPAENRSALLEEVAARCPNFRIIRDLSIKQWILASDQIYTWGSTSIAEIRAAKKGCGVLRPVNVPYGAQLEIYNHANFITDYETFFRSLDEPLQFPIPAEDFNGFYDIDEDRPSYMRICDFLEEVYKNDEYKMHISAEEQPYSCLQAQVWNLRNWIAERCITAPWMKPIVKLLRPGRNSDAVIENYSYTVQMRKNNYTSKKEIDTIMGRIRTLLSPYEQN